MPKYLDIIRQAEVSGDEAEARFLHNEELCREVFKTKKLPSFGNLGDLICAIQIQQDDVGAFPRIINSSDYQEVDFQFLRKLCKPARDMLMPYGEGSYNQRGYVGCTLCRKTVLDNFPLLRDYWWRKYQIWPNPVPIYLPHITIARNEHVMQQLTRSEIVDILLFMELAPQFRIFYNGPKIAGASVAKHQHFQGFTRELPVEKCIWQKEELTRKNGTFVYLFCRGPVHDNRLEYPARVIEIISCDKAELAKMVTRIMEAIEFPPDKMVVDVKREIADVNLLFSYSSPHYKAYIFPRSKDLPIVARVERLKVRPGAVEMSGVMTTGDQATYDKLTAEIIFSVLNEVSTGENILRELVTYVISNDSPP